MQKSNLLRKRIKQAKGITLVALVITIIVLLILAGVTINLTLGENGLITRAKEAKDKYEEAQNNEIAILNEMDYKIEGNTAIDPVDDATNNKQTYGRAWNSDYTLIGHASLPFVIRGGPVVWRWWCRRASFRRDLWRCRFLLRFPSSAFVLDTVP